MTLEVRLARRGDVDGLVVLESRYFIGNLDPAEHADGFISVQHSPGWFARAVDEGGVHVAVTPDGQVVGFIVVTAPPESPAPGLPPILAAMQELAQKLEFNGAPIARQRYAFRGPVCIAAEARGQGVYSRFNAVAAEAYRDRYDVGVLFVSADNPRSLHTTTAKLGAQVLAEFEAAGRRFHFLAFAFGGEAPTHVSPVRQLSR